MAKGRRGWAMFWAGLWISFIFLTSSSVITQQQLADGVASATGLGSSNVLQAWQLVWWIVVKGWHAVEFGVLYLLLRQTKWSPWTIVFLSISYAFFDELHQAFVRSRGGRLSDVCIDMIGIAVAWYLLDGKDVVRVSRLGRWLVCAAVIGAIYWLAMTPFGSLESLFSRG